MGNNEQPEILICDSQKAYNLSQKMKQNYFSAVAETIIEGPPFHWALIIVPISKK